MPDRPDPSPRPSGPHTTHGPVDTAPPGAPPEPPGMPATAADGHPALAYLATLSPAGRRTMAACLERMARLLSGDACGLMDLDWGRLRYQHTQALRALLIDQPSPRTGAPLAYATINKMLAALRGVLAEAWHLGLMDAEAYHGAARVPGVRGASLPRGRALAPGELAALFAACAADPSPAGARDAALLALLHAGPRRAELVALDRADLDLADGRLVVRHGKGNRARAFYVPEGGRRALADWLAVRGEAPGPLLCAVSRGGHLTPRRLGAPAVLEILGRLCRRAAVAPATPHDLRRSMISELLDAGVDIATVQRVAGHAQVTTTARYDRRGEAAKARAAALLDTPYRSPSVPHAGPEPRPGGPRGP